MLLRFLKSCARIARAVEVAGSVFRPLRNTKYSGSLKTLEAEKVGGCIVAHAMVRDLFLSITAKFWSRLTRNINHKIKCPNHHRPPTTPKARRSLSNALFGLLSPTKRAVTQSPPWRGGTGAIHGAESRKRLCGSQAWEIGGEVRILGFPLSATPPTAPPGRSLPPMPSQ